MPRLKRKIAIIGSAASAVITETNTTAPKKAPIPPGTASQLILDQSTLPNLQCDNPDAAVVATSPRWTAVEAMAGVRAATLLCVFLPSRGHSLRNERSWFSVAEDNQVKAR